MEKVCFDLNKKSKKNYILRYSIIFIVSAMMALLPFIIYHKSPIWAVDGLEQHYPSLMYVGSYLREFIKSIFAGNPQWNMWDLNVGLGSDVLGTLNYYCIGDPLDLLSVFVPIKYTEFLYDFLVVFRIYLAGLSFSLWCFYKKINRNNAMIGSLIYAFSSFTIVFGSEHPFFNNPLIYLPLLLIGLDKLLKKQHTWLFTGMITLSIVSNFYYFYILTVGIFIYAIYRVYNLYTKDRLKEYFYGFIRCTGYYLLGIMMSFVIFLPVFYALSNTVRSGESMFGQWLFSAKYYAQILPYTVSFGIIESQTNLGYFSVAVILLCILICIKDKKLRVYKVLTAISIAGLLLPVFGYAMNGFSYTANRWTLLFNFVIAMAAIRVMDRIHEVKPANFKVVVLLIIGTAISLFLAPKNDFVNEWPAIIFMIIATIVIAIIIRESTKLKKYMYLIFAIMLVVELGCKSCLLFIAWEETPFINKYTNFGDGYSLLNNKGIKKIKNNDESVYRVESGCDSIANYSLANDVASTSSYYSLTQKNISEMMEKIQNSNVYTTVWIKDQARRTSNMELAGVKYYFSHNKNKDLISVPYNYKWIGSSKVKDKWGETHKQNIYKNKSPLPLVYGYDNYMLKSDWNKLEAYDKEQAMLESAVVDKNVDSIKENIPQSEAKTVLTKDEILNQIKEYAKTNENIEVNGEEITIKYGSVRIPLKYQGMEDSETYLVLSGIDYDYMDKSYLKDVAAKQKENPKLKLQMETGSVNMYIGASYNGKNAFYQYCSKYYVYQSYDNTICNMGYEEKAKTNLGFYLGAVGKYTFKDIKVVCQPMTNYVKKVNNLKMDVNKLEIGGNRISCSVNNDKNKMICIAVPYSKGWTAKVDGKPVKISEINQMYMGVEMSEGKHMLELSYITPGLKEGAGITLLGIVILIGVTVKQRHTGKSK